MTKMFDLEFSEHLSAERGGFHSYIFWPAYIKSSEEFENSDVERIDRRGTPYRVRLIGFAVIKLKVMQD